VDWLHFLGFTNNSKPASEKLTFDSLLKSTSPATSLYFWIAPHEYLRCRSGFVYGFSCLVV